MASVAVGAKDSSRSLFSVWEALFTIPRFGFCPEVHYPSLRPQKVDKEGSGAGAGELANCLGARWRAAAAAVASCGEHERLVAGVFENYPAVKFRDSGLAAVVAGLEWITHFDLLHKEATKYTTTSTSSTTTTTTITTCRSQTWALMGHFSFPLVALHLLFASTTKQRVAFPTQVRPPHLAHLIAGCEVVASYKEVDTLEPPSPSRPPRRRRGCCAPPRWWRW